MNYFILIIKTPFTLSFITIVLFTFVFIFNAAGNMENGKNIYDRHCMQCHGTDGMGILAPPFVESTRFKSMDGVAALIDYIMPATSKNLCNGTDAEDAAEYIVKEFKFKIPKNKFDLENITDEAGRKALFDQTCSVCHGVDGKGDLARPILKSTLFKTKNDVVRFINGLMPFHNPTKCRNQCAVNAAQYIIDNFELELPVCE
jgi:mono/diheme cytochrome c family protein